MKALTLTQPWATLVAIGAKRIETRSWSTKYRGPLAIHAGKEKRFINMRHKDYVCGTEPFCSILTQHAKDIVARYHHPLEQAKRILPRGCVIAVCELVDCVKIPDLLTRGVTPDGHYGVKLSRYRVDVGGRVVLIPPDEPELSFGDYTPGRFAWILRNVQPLPEPIPVKGALGLWEWVQL